MFNALLFTLVGAFIGWATPQPQWAKDLQTKVSGWIKGLFIKSIS